MENTSFQQDLFKQAQLIALVNRQRLLKREAEEKVIKKAVNQALKS